MLAGHAGPGKTTLGEQLLHKSGAVGRVGKVDDGTSHLDFEPEEQKRRESLSLAVATFETDGTRITHRRHAGLPRLHGRGDLRLRRGRRRDPGRWTRRAGSRRVSSRRWRSGGRPARAACFFINKCDKENADPTAALDALRATFGNKIAPLQLAIGAAHDFQGYVDLVHRKAYVNEGGKEVETPIPAGMADEVARRRDQLLEAAAEADDDVLVKYLEGEEVSDPELEACLRKGVKESILAPVLRGLLGDRDRAPGTPRRDRPVPALPRRRRPR